MVTHLKIKLAILAFLFTGSALTAYAQDEQDAYALFDSDSLVHVKLTTDIKDLVKQKRKEEYQPAKIEIALDDGSSLESEIEVRSRGNIRKEVCYYPPIRLKFPKKEFSNHKIKLVISCRDSDAYDQILLKEYICYKLFQTITDNSFNVSLLKVDYVDTGRDNETWSRFAFAIEPEDQLAKRMDGRLYEPKVLRPRLLNPEQYAYFAFFQYMIANVDWGIANRHNMESIAHPATNTIKPVPYDFDYSGFVGTSYAVPNDDLPIKTVHDRYNRATCFDEDLVEQTRQLFLSKRAEMEKIVNEFPYFNDKTRKDVLNYIEPFFEIMEREKSTKQIFVNDCEEIASN